MEKNVEFEMKKSTALSDRDDVVATVKTETPRAKIVIDLMTSRSVGTKPKVLDIGCGYGTLSRAFDNFKIDLIEWSEKHMPIFHSVKVDYTGIDVYHKSAVITNFDLNSGPLPFDDKTFDFVVCTDVLEHLFYPHYVLKEIKRVLKDAGYAIISLPNSYNLRLRLRFLFGKCISRGFDSYGHHHLTSLKENRQFIEDEFKITKEKYRNLDGCYSKWITRVLGWTGKKDLYVGDYFVVCRK